GGQKDQEDEGYIPVGVRHLSRDHQDRIVDERTVGIGGSVLEGSNGKCARRYLGNSQARADQQIGQTDIKGLPFHERAEWQALEEDVTVEKARNENEIGRSTVDEGRHDIEVSYPYRWIFVGKMRPGQGKDMARNDEHDGKRTEILDI